MRSKSKVESRTLNWWRVLLFLTFNFGLSTAVLAQGGFTTVTGTITDPNGLKYACGTISAQLITAGGASATLNGGGFTTQTSPIGLGCPTSPGTGAPGSFAMRLADSGVINPSNTTWRFTINMTPGIAPPAGTGPQSFTVTTAINCGTNTPATCTSNQMDISTLLSASATALSNVAGGGSVSQGAIPGSAGINSVPIQSGLMAEYRMLPSETVSALVDYSGNGRNATGTVGTSPTIISASGGVQFNGNGAISLPASLNTALSHVFYACFQKSAGSTVNNQLIASTTTPTGLFVGTGFAAINTLFIGSRLATVSNSSVATQTNLPFNGCGTIIETMAASDHIYWNGQETAFYTSTGSSAGIATGNYQLGGNTAQFWQGQIYYYAAYNRAITQTEALADSAWLNSYVPSRGGTPPFQGITILSSGGDVILSTGDSIIGDFNLTTRWQSQVTLNSALNWTTVSEPIQNNGLPGKTLAAMASDTNLEVWPLMTGSGPANIPGTAGRNVVIGWGGTNDITLGANAATVESRLHRFSNAIAANPTGAPKFIFASMISRNGQDTGKNNWNTLLRLNSARYMDYFVDMASNPLVGADGASASAVWFQGDGVHWSQAGATNFGAFYFQRAVNALYGPSGFSSANTYTATSTAATTITAASSSGFISTITMGANPWASGQCVVITGMTPAGYNSPAGQCWFILPGATGTTFTFQNSVSGLGAGTVFGTAQSAQELDQDTLFEILGGSAAGPSHIIQTCQGRDPNKIKLVQITNTNASPWTLTSLVGETINGVATLTAPVASATNHPVIAMKPILTSASAAGCTWQASIQ